jgi:hypothetical protein
MDRQTISHSPHFAAQRPERRVDLDWVRIGVFGLLIFYHVGMLYVSWEFHIKSAHRVTALEPLMLVLNPWRLALLFLVSGVATRFMLLKYTVGPLLGARSTRLLVPLIFGMLVMVPPQAYLQIVESLGYPAGFLDFYARHYFAFGPQFCDPGPCIVLPTWNHLWFVAYLWVYTIALGAVLIAAPGLLGWIERRLVSALSGVLLLIVPSAALAAYRLALLPSFPPTHACLAIGTTTRFTRQPSCWALCWRARKYSGKRSRASGGGRCRWRLLCFCPFSCCDGVEKPQRHHRCC